MINLNALITTVENDIKKLQLNDQIIVSTFKKDRHITITKVENDLYNVLTNGYTHQHITNLSLKETIKILKKYRDIEFPRSNKIYISIRKFKNA